MTQQRQVVARVRQWAYLNFPTLAAADRAAWNVVGQARGVTGRTAFVQDAAAEIQASRGPIVRPLIVPGVKPLPVEAVSLGGHGRRTIVNWRNRVFRDQFTVVVCCIDSRTSPGPSNIIWIRSYGPTAATFDGLADGDWTFAVGYCSTSGVFGDFVSVSTRIV